MSSSLLLASSSFIVIALIVATLRLRDPLNQAPSHAFLVLGDIGRSPRMRNHALALSRAIEDDKLGDSEQRVFLIGYTDTEVPAAVRKQTNICIVPLKYG